MKNLLFKKSIVINSTLTIEQIKNKIQQVILPQEKFSFLRQNENYKFEGFLKENNFRIYQLFDYGQNNLLRPEINGQINIYDQKSQVILTFGLSKTLRRLFLFVLLLNIILTIVFFQFSFDKWWMIPIALSVSYIFTLFQFYSKVSECIRILKRLLKVQ